MYEHLIFIMVNFLLRLQGFIHRPIFLPPLPLHQICHSIHRLRVSLTADSLDISDGTVLARHARGPGFESR